MGASGSALAVSTPKDLEIVMTRKFNAARDLVFEAHSSCEHMKHWWGPRRYEIASCDMDFRPGGAWRIVHRGSDGQEFGFRGEFRDIVRPERITWTFEFEPMAGHISVQTVKFEEQDGKTLVTTTSQFDSVQDRDGMLQSGMEQGLNQSYAALDRLLATLD